MPAVHNFCYSENELIVFTSNAQDRIMAAQRLQEDAEDREVFQSRQQEERVDGEEALRSLGL